MTPQATLKAYFRHTMSLCEVVKEESYLTLCSRLRSRSLKVSTKQISTPSKNGRAPPPTESRKSNQSVNPDYVWTWWVFPCWVEWSCWFHFRRTTRRRLIFLGFPPPLPGPSHFHRYTVSARTLAKIPGHHLWHSSSIPRSSSNHEQEVCRPNSGTGESDVWSHGSAVSCGQVLQPFQLACTSLVKLCRIIGSQGCRLGPPGSSEIWQKSLDHHCKTLRWTQAKTNFSAWTDDTQQETEAA